MKVVSTSSVLIVLSSIEQLDLLSARFPEGIYISDAVWREVVETGGGRASAEDISKAGWISRVPVRDMAFVTLLRSELDVGEAEALTLAHEENSPSVLMDEKEARRVAQRLEIHQITRIYFPQFVSLVKFVANQLENHAYRINLRY